MHLFAVKSFFVNWIFNTFKNCEIWNKSEPQKSVTIRLFRYGTVPSHYTILQLAPIVLDEFEMQQPFIEP